MAGICRIVRRLSTAVPKRETVAKKKTKLSRQILEYVRLEESASVEDMEDIQETLPDLLLKSGVRPPPEMYAVGPHAVEETARILAARLLPQTAPLVEVNPGPARLTARLLREGFRPVHLFESDAHFEPLLTRLRDENPDKIRLSFSSFFNMWKTAHQDKMDGGNRHESLFLDFPPKPWGREVAMNVLGATPSLSFITHTIASILLQNSLVLQGRPEFYLWMSPSNYYSLVTDEKCELRSSLFYRQIPVLFNILFDHELLSEAPRKDFLPWKRETKTAPSKRAPSKASILDTNSMYLVYIKPKKTYPVAVDDLPLLGYFVKHHTRCKTNRIIPMMEQWIPGCGVWLITGQDSPGTCTAKGPNKNDAKLPHFTIFTRFSDLTPLQILTLFKRFISWPEFEQSQFRDSLENHTYFKGIVDEYGKSNIALEEENNESSHK